MINRMLKAVVFISIAAVSSAGADTCVEVMRLAEQFVGLSAREPAQCVKLNQQHFRLVGNKLFALDTQPERLRLEERLMKLLGMIGPNYPYADCAADSAGANTAAFYSPRTKRLYLPSWIPAPRKLLVHELTHVLQDQHFDTSQLGKREYSDGIFAAAALIEGHATSVERRYQDRFGVREDQEEVDDSLTLAAEDSRCAPPEILQQVDSEIYAAGERFIETVFSKEISVTQLFSEPPIYALEILYPEVYLHRANVSVLPPELPQILETQGRGLPLAFEDSLGVALLRAWTGRASMSFEKEWRGDRVGLYADGELRQGVLFVSRWATLESAQSFAEILRRQMAKITTADHSRVSVNDGLVRLELFQRQGTK